MTDAALELLRRVKDERGEALVLVIGNGCCDSTAPYLFADYLPGPNEHEVGRVDDVPIFLDEVIASSFDRTEVVVDVRADSQEEEDSFSCETELGQRFCLERLPSS
jgi:uncharacterized protein (DUF779 family)